MAAPVNSLKQASDEVVGLVEQLLHQRDITSAGANALLRFAVRLKGFDALPRGNGHIAMMATRNGARRVRVQIPRPAFGL